MTERVRVGIAGTGSYAPAKVIDNAYWERLVDTSDEWIVQRTGIKQRRFVADDQATSDLAALAGKHALENAGIAPEDIDLIVLGTASPDALIPPASPLVPPLPSPPPDVSSSDEQA